MIKPILFCTPMVQAILDGRKTMTRRVVKPQPRPAEMRFTGDHYEKYYGYPLGHDRMEHECKYQPGDILWVRETWADEGQTTSYDNDGTVIYHKHYFAYKEQTERMHWGQPVRWRPSIFMPKEACRIFLRVTDVRVELVQEILCGDMKREGCIPETVTGGQYQQWQRDYWIPLWDSINAKRGYGWDANPWVWVISFELCEKPESWR